MLPRLDTPWPLADVPPLATEAALGLAETADGTMAAHWQTLHVAMLNRATDVVSALTIALIMFPLRHVDRYGKPLDHYGVEIEPLLGAMVGSHLPDLVDLASVHAAIAQLDDALGLMTLALMPLRGDLHPVSAKRLTDGMTTISTQLHNLAADCAPRPNTDARLPVVRLLSRLGRLNEAEVLAGLHCGTPHNTSALTVAATWRYLHGFDRALAVVQTIIEHDPRNMAARNTLAAVLCDTGRYLEAHKVALRLWASAKSPYTARVLLRTAKATDDTESFATARHYLAERNELRRLTSV